MLQFRPNSEQVSTAGALIIQIHRCSYNWRILAPQSWFQLVTLLSFTIKPHVQAMSIKVAVLHAVDCRTNTSLIITDNNKGKIYFILDLLWQKNTDAKWYLTAVHGCTKNLHNIYKTTPKSIWISSGEKQYDPLWSEICYIKDIRSLHSVYSHWVFNTISSKWFVLNIKILVNSSFLVTRQTVKPFTSIKCHAYLSRYLDTMYCQWNISKPIP